MSRTILVVGGTGMLGKPVVRRLLAAGYSIRLLARTPEKARAEFGDACDIREGDVGDSDSIARALDGADAVHISLNGGPTPEDYDRVEHRGVANVAQAAKAAGVRHLTHLSGISARPENAFFPPTAAKLKGIDAIIASGVPYTIFRPTWFYESLHFFIRNGKPVVLGSMRQRWGWLAADDYARMVVRAYEVPEAGNQVFDLIGPEPMTLPEALKQYSKARVKGRPVKKLPFWWASVIANVTRNTGLRRSITMMRFWDQYREVADPDPANHVLGAPTTTLAEWLGKTANVTDSR